MTEQEPSLLRGPISFIENNKAGVLVLTIAASMAFEFGFFVSTDLLPYEYMTSFDGLPLIMSVAFTIFFSVMTIAFVCIWPLHFLARQQAGKPVSAVQNIALFVVSALITIVVAIFLINILTITNNSAEIAFRKFSLWVGFLICGAIWALGIYAAARHKMSSKPQKLNFLPDQRIFFWASCVLFITMGFFEGRGFAQSKLLSCQVQVVHKDLNGNLPALCNLRILSNGFVAYEKSNVARVWLVRETEAVLLAETDELNAAIDELLSQPTSN